MPTQSTREAQFAGSFYPAEERELHDLIERWLVDFREASDGETVKAQGCFVPHAGYMYSGECAAATFARLEVPDRVLLLHTKHVPHGYPLSISTHSGWQTPLGIMETDRELAARLHQLGPARNDEVAEDGEHSGEVVLPFLQVLNTEAKVCVVAVGHVDRGTAKALGAACATAVREAGESNVLIVASTDMNHYQSHLRTQELDEMALGRMEAMDPDGLLEVVEANKITMCGAGATAVMMHACIELGCNEFTLVDYTNSGVTTGDYEQVVGYASGYVR